MSEAITLCHDCRQHNALTPFWTFTSQQYWWLGATPDNPRLLCNDCHAAAVNERHARTDLIPYWYTVGMGLRDYVWPDRELVLTQETLL